MPVFPYVRRQLHIHKQFVVFFVSLLVGAYGVYIIASTLLDQIFVHHIEKLSALLIDLPLLLGLSVIYLSTLLRRRKHTAWLVTIIAYTIYLGISITRLLSHIGMGKFWWVELLHRIIVPLIILLFLFYLRREFIVKSDIQGFHFALKFILIILSVTIIYGVTGFELMDRSDFHQEIGWQTALHYTVDQFNLTTSKPIQPQTRRAHLFVDSLSFVSLVSIIYVAFSLFQPLRSRFSDQSLQRERVSQLFNHYGAESEEFFKIWPHDKQYFFDDSGQSVIAFHVYRGVALCLSDPIGNKQKFSSLMSSFLNLCFNNDWLPAFIHVSEANRELYQKFGLSLQKLGQEAIVDIDHFERDLKNSKYFRQILNKFSKQGYSYELLIPPHHQEILDRLKAVSDEWLSKGSKSERGFAMGYFTYAYLQMCQVAVVRDAAGTIQAFATLVPAEFDHQEATYDLLRVSDKGLSNISDFLLMKLIEELYSKGYKRLNMGLSPLAGLNEENNEERTLLDNVLKFAYANGDMFFSFSGLHRFKSKYEPNWQDKYIVYKGGIAGFSKSVTALTRAMSKVVKL